MMAYPKVQIFEGDDGQHYFRVRSSNGKTLSISEGYSSPGKAERGAVTFLETVGRINTLNAQGEWPGAIERIGKLRDYNSTSPSRARR
jgi:uncharacterized protein YegP (UPF0339 family)